jgi:hypothetical protein
MSEADYAGLVTAAHTQLHAPVILVWDNLNTHISAAMRAFIDAHPDWLTETRPPAYAPDLNAVEGAWANMKKRPGQPRRRRRGPAHRDHPKPAEKHPVPARPHRRLPRSDQAQPRPEPP